MTLHVPCGSGLPEATLLQWPGAPARAQLWHAPVHATSQQRPSAHWLDTHSAASTHDEPLGFFPQDPFMHEFGETQSPSFRQIGMHAVPEHW